MDFADKHGLPRTTVPYLVDPQKRTKVLRKRPEEHKVPRLDNDWVVSLPSNLFSRSDNLASGRVQSYTPFPSHRDVVIRIHHIQQSPKTFSA